MSGKVRLLTSAWFKRLEEVAQRLASSSPAARFVLIERYPGAPQDPALYGTAQPGYRLEIADGGAQLTIGAPPARGEADADISVAYEAFTELSMLPSGPALSERAAWWGGQGAFSVHGDMSRAPFDFNLLHDAMQACSECP